MSRRRRKKKAVAARKESLDFAALSSALSRVDRFVKTLWNDWQAADARFEAAATGTRSAARAWQELEDAWSDYESAKRLRSTVAAALASAQLKAALIEADAYATVAGAFAQFKEERNWPRGKRGAAALSAEKPKSSDELAEMVAVAKEAVAYVLVDRNRLTERLVDTRAAAIELRAQLTSEAAVEPPEYTPIRQRIELCEQHATYLEQQLMASATAAQQLLLGLRELMQGLPEPVASALPGVEARRGFGREEN